MITDIATVFWKEFREILFLRGTKVESLIVMVVPAFLFGVIFPTQFAESWTTSPFSLLVWIIVPFMLISALIADSFAGERERHTLETLLATRLSEQSILTGKISAAICYALLVTICIVFLGLITVNILHRGGGLIMFTGNILFWGLVCGILTASTAANVGTLVSLRAATVRQAQQTLGLFMFAVLFSPSIIAQFAPYSLIDGAEDFFRNVGLNTTVVVTVGILLCADCMLFLIAIRRFKRDRMIVGDAFKAII